ncbi:MAG TPA: CCA tRNA nucleotidyltransferase [Nitriliruptoraceae bacterium]|nr:CCA tRNA nucleotidyltransferase [Nitriliruptoraceae bacterium]
MASSTLTDAQAAQLGRLVDVFPEARELGDLFADAGHELYLVGGTVRDALLAGGDADAAALVDLDFATSARPDDTAALLEPWGDALWLTGAEFGTVSTIRQYDGQPDRIIEITTYRSDAYEPGSRHPDVTFGDSIDDDLARRDFTMNAMAVRVPDFHFVDLFGGISDLHAKRLRTPQDPQVSFGDDPLRMVRLARFAARFDGVVEEATLAAAVAMADQLTTISVERIRDELVKLMESDHPTVGLQLLVDTGLDAHVLPELRVLSGLRDPLHRHKDVWAHTLAVIDNAIALEPAGPDAVLRLAALLHDIGKPQTREIHADGTVSFHHHDVVGARMTRHRMRALAFDKATTRAVSELVRMHLRFHTYKMGWTDAAVRRYVRDAGDLLQRLNILTRADVTTGNARRARAIQDRMDDLEARIVVLQAEEELAAMRPPIDGNQVMAHTGMAPGPLVGQAWEWLLELRLEAGPVAEPDAYRALDVWWAAVDSGHPEPDAATVAADLGLV